MKRTGFYFGNMVHIRNVYITLNLKGLKNEREKVS